MVARKGISAVIEAVLSSVQVEYDQHIVSVQCNNQSTWWVGQETYLSWGNMIKGEERGEIGKL